MMIHSRPEMLQARPEMIHDHQTAPTQFVEANGIRFAYRRFGKSGGVPLVVIVGNSIRLASEVESGDALG